MSISDDFIKKILGESPKNEQSSQQSKKKSGSIADDFIRKHNYDVDDSFINTFLSDANRYVNSATNDHSNVGWSNASSSYKSRSDDWSDLNYRAGIVQGWLETNKDRLDEKTYKEYSSFLDGLRTSGSEIVGAFSEAKNYYSQWDTEDAYIKSAVENREARQKRYEDNQKRITELMASASVDDLLFGNVKEELQRLAAENQKYERGEDGYISKVVDDYSRVTQNSDFGVRSANRAYKNASKEELWDYDMSVSNGSVALSSGGYVDEYGNIYNSSGELVQSASAPVVEDKLGMFLSAGEGAVEEAYNVLLAANGNYNNTWADMMLEGDHGSWKYLSEEEIGIYYYLLNESQESAYKYLSDMETELNRRKTLGENEYWNKAYAEANLLEKIAMNAATIPAKFFSSGTGFIEDTISTIKGEDINPYSHAHSGMHFSQTVRDNTATELDDTGFKIPLIDFTLGDIYQTGMSRIDSALATSVFGGGGTIFLGMGAAQEEAYKLYKQGASAEQITLGAFSAGAAEAIWENVSYGKLQEMKGKDIDTIGKWVKSVLIQGANEASEEALTEVSNIITNALVMGSQSDLAELYKENDEAAFSTFVDLLKQTTHAAFGGFIGGFGAGAVQATDAYRQNTSQYRDTGNTIMKADGGVDALKNLANEVAGVSDSKMKNSLTKLASNVSDKVATGDGIRKVGATIKNARNETNIGRLYNKVQTANNLANASANQADIAKSLQRKDFDSDTANDIAEALVARYNGQELTKEQVSLLEAVDGDKDVMAVVDNIINNEQSTMGQRSQNIRDFQGDIYKGVVTKSITEAIRKNTTENQFTPAGEYDVSDSGKAINTESGEDIDIKGVSAISKGKMVLELADGTTIDAKSVSFASGNDALIYEAIANLGDNISAETANKLIAKYDGSNAEIFARGIAQAYTYGFYGIDRTEMTGEHSLATELTKEQRNYAYGLGEQYRSVKDQADKAKARARKAPGEKGVFYRDKDGNATDIRSYLKKDGRVLNEMQTTGIEFMEKMSKMMGVRFNVFESWVENGTRYYLDENGEKTEGSPNGFYDPKTGEIYIDLFAGNDFQGTMLFTVAHELTHFMRQWSPEHFTKIAKIVFQHAGFKGSVSSLVADKMNSKRRPDYDTALEEVVADGMETILKDGKVAEFMADVKKTDRKVWEKLKEWFKNFAEFLKKMVNAYSGQSAQTVEGRKVADFSKKLLNQIEQIWAEGAVSAGENYQEAIDGYKAEQEQFSTDTIRGNADGAVVQSDATTSIVAKEQPRTEYEAFPKQIMNLSDGAGTILDFIEGLTPTKVKGLAGKGINGYTGRDVRGYAMGISGFTQAQIKAVNEFMDTMADFMEEAGVTYRFIGLQDVENAQLHYTYNADGSIKSIVLSAMVKNGDYPVNFDLSSICKKRVAMSKLIDKLAKRGSLDNGTVKLTPANIFKINTALKDAGYETACLGCFVESKRYNSLEWAKKFCDKWNAAVKKVNPNATYFGYGDATFSEDSFTLEQAIKIDDAANKYIKATKTERLANALEKYKAKEQAGQPLVTSISKAALDRLRKSDTISDELKTKYLNCDPTTLNMADVEFLLENGILPGAALSNKQAVTEMVKSGEAYQHLLRPSDLLTDRGISKLEALPNFHGVLYGHYGSGTPKLMQSYTPYNSEIALLPASKGEQSLAEYLYTIAGVRMQSFSDFQIQNIYDYLQMVGDLAARKVPAHAYTKELPFAKLLGMTGIKVNLSVMFDIDPMVDKAHAGLTKLNKLVHRGEYAKVVLEDEQGRWVYNIGDYQTQKMFAEAFPDEAKRFLQSIGFADAVKLQSSTGYSANCGIIGVGYSDLGILAMLDDNRIRYIIPYHASSLPAEIKAATHIELGTDYTPYQNNMKISEIVDRNGNKVNWTIKEAYKRLGSGQTVLNELNEKIRTEGWVVKTTKAQNGHGSYGLYEDLQQTNDPRQTASNFMDWCIGNSTLPLFYQFASHENYYKLLYDYNVYDCVTEEYAPQQAVTNTYPTMVDGQVQPGNVIDGGFDAEYFKGTIDKQMAFMNEYSRNLDEDLEQLAENMEEGKYTLFSDRGQNTDVTSWDINWDEDNNSSIKSQMVKHMSEINQMNPVADIEFDKSKGKTYANILDEVLRTKFGYKIERADGASFLFDKVAIATLRRYVTTDEEAAAVTAAPYVLKRGKAISGHKNHKGNRYPSVTYAGPVTINGERVNVGVVVLFGDKNRPHSLRVLMPSGKEYVLKKTETDSGRRWALPDGSVRSSTESVSTDKVTQKKQEVKKFSDRDNAPTFYSHMARVVDAVKQEKLGASSVVSMLRGKGVKAEEIKWSGIEEWLAGKKSVTKAELQEFIAGSMLQIEEETLDNKDRPYTEDQKKRLGEHKAKQDEVTKRVADEWKKITGKDLPISIRNAATESGVVSAIMDANKEHKDASFEGRLLRKLKKDLEEVVYKNDDFGFDYMSHAIHSIHRHRKDFLKYYEMSSNDKAVITKYCNALNAYNELPNLISDEDADRLRSIAREGDQYGRKMAEVMREHDKEQEKYATHWDDYTIKGGKNYREILFKMPGSSYSNGAMYAHWNERKGVLAHARVQDFDVNGKKMLFIEEIQSDWHNAGHKDGYRDPSMEDKHTLSKKMEKYTEEFFASPIADVVRERIAPIGYEGAGVSMILNFLMDSQESMESTLNTLSRKGASFTDSEVNEIAKYAREYEKMYHAWETAPGDFTAPDAPFKDTYHEYVMKRLLREAAENGYDSIGWTTAQTQVERWSEEFAEGYRIEYDQDIPKFLKKYGKKWGAEVGKTNIGAYSYDIPGETEAPTDIGDDMWLLREDMHFEDKGTEVWYMDITPAMKESVMTEGQPLYSDRVLMGSLFSGGGTLEAGLVYQMLDKEFAVEYEASLASIYADNHGKDHLFVGDVRDFNSKDKQNVFYLHASPVCKNFSPASHSGGETTTDITTAQATARVLEEQMPQVFTVENVKRYKGSEAYTIITDKLTELGYKWDVDVYKASDYGNATKRERMIIRAVKDGDLPAKPAKVSGITSWGEATRDLWETDLIPSTLVKSKIEAIRNTPALKNLKLTKLDKPLMIYDTNKSKQVTYAWADELAPTLTTKCGDARIIMPDGRVYEPTPKFMGRIQGLPDDYKYPKAKTNAFKIIGNGIPTQLTKAVIGGVLDSAYEQTHDGQVLYQDRAEDSVSNRSLLANALEGVAKPEELQKIQEYKDKVALINAEEKKLRELNEQIKELSFAKGPRDNDRIKALRFDANQTANRINTYDKQLLRLEASKPLQDVLDREKKKAYQRAEKRGKEALDAYREKAAKTQRALLEKWQESRKKAVESREKTAMKHKIQSVVGELNQLLLNDDKKRHVPDSLKKAVADALALVNMDTVGAEERAAKYAALIAKETDPDKIDAYTVTMENILRQGEKMGQRLKELRDAYEEIQNSDDPDIANGYDPVISGCIKELAESIGNTSLKDMSIEQLEDVYSMYKMVLTRVRDANKSLIESIKENISSRASAVIGQVRDVGGEHKDRASILDPVKAFFWNNAKPVYAMERIGSSAFTEAYNNVRKGEDTWAKDVTEARAYYLDKSNKYGYDSWDFDKKYTFESTSGIEFELTLEQMMALYAYSKRDQAFEHLRLGGFVFDSNIETYKETVEEKDGKVKKKKSILKYKVNTADAHQLTPETLASIISTIEKEAPGAKDFVDEMQDYLSTVMGAKGNEVTMKMYGVKLFKEKFYFPLKSAKQFMFEQNEVSGEVKIKNSGFTNKTKPKANNPIILSNFMDVWANHVNDMSMYHSFVLPLEDFNRIFNYNSPKKEGVPPVSVKGTIQSAYSPAAVSYVKQLITDLNGGAMSDPRETFAKTMMSKFKKAKVFASLSVVIQQPSAIGRAFALVDPKYFRPTKDGMNHEELWSELKQYAPVAIIKEMGYFDTNMGKSTLDFIKAKEYSTFKEKAKAIFTDEGYRDEKLSRLPALADELSWCAIWNAVKRETVSTHKDIIPGSEEFLKVAGERFTEVVTKTQVYDSVLARSANMRSKSGLMSMVTSFMAEPTTSINMLEDAILKGKRGNKRYASRAFASVAVSVILNNALVALVYGARDDDDDETFAEKYMQAFVSGMIDDLNPLTYYPYLKDMWSLLQGYDIERADMSLVSDLADAMKGMVKAYTSEDGDAVGAWHDMAGTIANIGGVPMQNISRDINGAINFFRTFIDDVNGRDTTWGSMGDALEDTVKDSLPVVGWFPSETKADKLYDAIISGDTAYVNRLKGSYKDEDAYHNAVRKALRENDTRIKEAAIAGYNGNPSERVRIARLIIADGFDQDDVVAAINAEVNDMKPDEPSEPKKKGFYTASDFATEIANGDQASAYTAKEDIIATAQKNGKTEEEAKKSFVSSAKTELKKLFKAGTISEQKLIDTLVNFCDMEYDDAEKYAGGAAFEVAHPELDGVITYTQYQRWESDGQPRGVSLEMFVDVASFRDDGTSNSVKSQEEVALYISSVTSDTYLRDALWCCFYNESTLKNAPWH